MSSNTRILIKRSQDQNAPSLGTLKDGELGYSYASNTLFIGNANNDTFGYDVVGGAGLLASLSANLTIGDAASNTANINLQTDTLTFRGTNGVTANVGPDMFGEPEVVISLTEGSFVRSNTGATNTTQIITTKLQIDGDLIVNGTTTTINSTTVETGDAIIVLANNNTTNDSTDIGFAGKYNDGTSNLFSGLVRDSSTGGYALFQDYDTFGSGITNISISSLDQGSDGTYANLHANLVSQDVTTSKFNLTTDRIALGPQTDVYGRGIAIGRQASANTGDDTSSVDAIAIGYQANDGQLAGQHSVAIGTRADASNTYSIAIGYQAVSAQFDDTSMVGSIVLNATSFGLTAANTGFYVAPVRQVHPEEYETSDGIAMYNASTKELRFTHTLDGGSF
jgi:hypothetical protein